MAKSNLVLIILFFICFLCYSKNVPDYSETVEVKDVHIANQSTVRKSYINYKELMNDIDFLLYYLRTAYVGYDTLRQNGYDEKTFKSIFSERFGNTNKIDTKEILIVIANELSRYADDKHLILNGTMGKEYIIMKGSSLFFYTNTFVEKKGNEYVLYESDFPELTAGNRYDGSEENLFYYPSKGANIYRIGVITEHDTKNYDFSFEGKKYNLFVYNDGFIQPSPTVKYHEIETSDSVYVSLSSFVLPDKTSQFRKGAVLVLEKFANIGSKWRNKKNIIIDLRSNAGGITAFGEYAFWSMTLSSPIAYSEKSQQKMEKFIDENYRQITWIESPTTIQAEIENLKNITDESSIYLKETEKKWKKMQKEPIKEAYTQKNTKHSDFTNHYNGNIIILIDRNSASASENTALVAKKIMGNNVKIIGEKSAGCLKYWGIKNYLLPNSGLSISLASIKNNQLNELIEWHGEGNGVYPDYWSIGKDLNETIFFVTGDTDMKEKLINIEYRMQ